MNAEMSEDLQSLDSKNNSESKTSTSKPNNSMEEYSWVPGQKRKSCMSLESPTKRQRVVVCKTTELAVEALMARGTKRKSSTERESPEKKKRGCSNKSDISAPPEVPVESVKTNGTKRNTDTNTNTGERTEVSVETESKRRSNTEQLSVTETPRTSLSDSSCSPSPSSCGPSSSKQDNRSMSCTSKNIKKFKAKYVQLKMLGKGGFGSVYAGYRRTDNLPVAIKHVQKEVKSQPVVLNGKTCMVPTEVILMCRAAGIPDSIGESAAITLLDWFDLEQEVVIVMERPVPSLDLSRYLVKNRGRLEENQAKNIMKQLVEAAIEMHSKGVFHQDIKLENILVETGSDVPRVRVIDFGCGCFLKKRSYREYSGTYEYAPPEFQSKGKYKAGPATVWQLGALLYELLDGLIRFITRFRYQELGFFINIWGLHVSEDCKDFLKMCLAEDPKQRATLEQLQLHPWLT